MLVLGLDGASWYKRSQGRLNYKTMFILQWTRPQFIVHRKVMKHIRCVPTKGQNQKLTSNFTLLTMSHDKVLASSVEEKS